MRLLSLLTAIGLLTAPRLAAQTVVGRITAEAGGLPLSGASVSLRHANGEQVARTETDQAGLFSVRAAQAGEYVVTADFLGYTRLESPLMQLGEDATVSVDFELPTDPIEVEGLRVEVERQREVHRRVAQYGVDSRLLGPRLVSRSEIAKRETASNFGQVLQWQNLASVSVKWTELPPAVCVRLGRGQPGCALMVLDGQVIDAEYAATVPPQSLEAIVVLRPVEATLSFGTDATNGAILLFTTAAVRAP